jgi:8-oxo-dGTP pyrophosphatase MutT (NUDIX family)
MERKEVVTAFLRSKGKVLIVRRSARVGTYRDRWSAISGYLEDATPLDQAVREILEETGLSREVLHLVCEGERVEVVDQTLDRHWVVHPFLFDIDNQSVIRLDWENVEMRWVSPKELASYPTVPALKNALEHCLVAESHHD